VLLYFTEVIAGIVGKKKIYSSSVQENCGLA